MASGRGQRRGDLDGVDDASAQLIISLQLQDISEQEKKSNGYKPPFSKERDTLVANSLYRQNLQELETNIKDRHLAQSIARAVVEDASVIANLVRAEERAREDRSMAISMAPRQRNTGLSPAPPQVEEHHGELLARMASMYVSRNTGRALMPNDVLERETQRRGNQGQANQQTHQCIVCFENKSYFEVLTVPCNHDYCGPCLQELFSEAYRDESLFPPRCCRTTIPVNLTSIELFLPRQLRDPYETRRIETTTTERTYCSNTYCGRFILPAKIVGKRAGCTACLTLTCGGCKKGYHTGGCNRDEAKEKTLELAAQMGWRRCNGCQQMVELAHGCNHMSCPCGHQFCYECGAKWKTCQCRQWHEPRLLTRANVIVDRNPDIVQGARRREQLVRNAARVLRERHECEHPRWWDRVEGAHRCEECDTSYRAFILECPGCMLRACVRCKQNRLR